MDELIKLLQDSSKRNFLATALRIAGEVYLNDANVFNAANDTRMAQVFDEYRHDAIRIAEMLEDTL